MDLDSALEILGLAPGATWAEARLCHRKAIRVAHPDAGGSAALAARLNEALGAIREATDSGERPTPRVTSAPAPSPAPVTPTTHTVAAHDATTLLHEIAEAGHRVGEVVFIDPLAGLLEIIVGVEPNVGQLSVAVSQGSSEGVPVAFTLEPLGSAPAPAINDVVRELMGLVRRQRL